MNRNGRVSRRDHYELENNVPVSGGSRSSNRDPGNGHSWYKNGSKEDGSIDYKIRHGYDERDTRDRDHHRSKYTDTDKKIRQRSRERDSNNDNRNSRSNRTNFGNEAAGNSKDEGRHISTESIDVDTTPRSKKCQESNDYKKRNSFSESSGGNTTVKNKNGEIENDSNVGEVNNEEDLMAQMMGFQNFGTTKGKKVSGNNASGAYKPKAGSFRQYMNREKGFNRPLSPPPSERRHRS